MLEILCLYYLCKNLGQKLREKGRKPLFYQVMLVMMWFGGEIVGAIVATVVHLVVEGQPPPEFSLPIYAGAIIGAVCGAGFSFMIVWLLPPAYKEPTFANSPENGLGPEGFQPPDPDNPYSSPQTWDN